METNMRYFYIGTSVPWGIFPHPNLTVKMEMNPRKPEEGLPAALHASDHNACL